ncbi:MAG: hypothetical protein Q8N35_06175 [Methylococcaceae bacterium]|nr:hypothetical protein [Methylococcaceae bacterium]MDP2394116.1 hypothetical protein [Methylococcaceae bacterium]MDP3019155.1 hypothetical protein [Methylococcaceae bacterium]MDP3388694.1 hypothetical protein [Methylococcaceae bacterium]MDZ4219071.1 hypothetical protein [Methylobacter sp.]
MNFLHLERVAEEITQNESFGDYLEEGGFKSRLHEQLHEAALSGDLICFDTTTKGRRRPKAHERVIFTTAQAVNDWFIAIESPLEFLDEPLLNTVNVDAGNKTTSPQAVVNKEVKKKRTRKTNLIRAIEAAVKFFPKKPSFDELWQYFQNEKDTTGFIEDYTDTKLTWLDTKGKCHDTKKATIANHLSRLSS